MSPRKKTRKIYLYRGNEAVTSFAQPSSDSRLKSLRSILDHFKRNPTLTHASLIDVKGKNWTIARTTGRATLIWILLRLS